jgi:hypothetical protein
MFSVPRFVALLLTGMTLALAPALRAFSGEIWEDFLRDPVPTNLTALSNSIAVEKRPCGRKSRPSHKQMGRLLTLVKSGNSVAFRAVLVVKSCLGVGDSEDLARSAGELFEVDLISFMDVVAEVGVPDEQFGDMITMLPLSLVDDVTGQLAALDHRISLLETLRDQRFEAYRAKALDKLLNRRRALMEIRSTM